jgi:hypothetical protein
VAPKPVRRLWRREYLSPTETEPRIFGRPIRDVVNMPTELSLQIMYIILHSDLYGRGTWSLTLKVVYRSRVFENKTIFVPK